MNQNNIVDGEKSRGSDREGEKVRGKASVSEMKENEGRNVLTQRHKRST